MWWKILAALLLIVGVVAPAGAEWRYANEHPVFGESPTALASSVSGGHDLALVCWHGVPTISVVGFEQKTGSDRRKALDVVVDGLGFRLEALHSPPDGVWFAPAPSQLMRTLKRGNVAVVLPMQASTSRYSLDGSAESIDRMLAACDR
ncbi:hypothetical protein ACUN9Y_15450 [Halomonas sp. V046]|uniref:hypothetical protein n=1 Tax=Halomonas sp. V046 TaxID=3459611 RepID=UPI004044B5ED